MNGFGLAMLCSSTDVWSSAIFMKVLDIIKFSKSPSIKISNPTSRLLFKTYL